MKGSCRVTLLEYTLDRPSDGCSFTLEVYEMQLQSTHWMDSSDGSSCAAVVEYTLDEPLMAALVRLPPGLVLDR